MMKQRLLISGAVLLLTSNTRESIRPRPGVWACNADKSQEWV